MHLQTIADPTRQRILQLVWNRELPAGEIASQFPLTFGAISQHLNVLREAGLVEQRKSGRHRLYRARKDSLGALATYLEQTWGMHLELLKEAAEKADHA
jgi:DNA-binding transcriptional ArsR family regulator